MVAAGELPPPPPPYHCTRHEGGVALSRVGVSCWLRWACPCGAPAPPPGRGVAHKHGHVRRRRGRASAALPATRARAAHKAAPGDAAPAAGTRRHRDPAAPIPAPIPALIPIPAAMPFLGQDWRSPGQSWVKTADGWTRFLDEKSGGFVGDISRYRPRWCPRFGSRPPFWVPVPVSATARGRWVPGVAVTRTGGDPKMDGGAGLGLSEGHWGLGGYRGWIWGGELWARPVALRGKAHLGCLRGLYRALQT